MVRRLAVLAAGQIMHMFWVLGLVAWLVLALLLAPVIGRALAQADRVTERPRAHSHRFVPLQRSVRRLG